MVTDKVGDFLTRIRNVHMRNRTSLVVPSSKTIQSIAEILKDKGFIKDFKVIEAKPQNSLEVFLKYTKNKEPMIRKLERVSKPGARVYVGYKDIPTVLSGYGIAIVSTPKGIMTGEDAKKQKVGGEYFCNIW